MKNKRESKENELFIPPMFNSIHYEYDKTKYPILHKAKQHEVPSGDTVTVGTVVMGTTEKGEVKTITAYFDEKDITQLMFAPHSEDGFQYGALIEIPKQKRIQMVYISKSLYVYLQDKFWKTMK